MNSALRSLARAIRPYLEPTHTEWRTYCSEPECPNHRQPWRVQQVPYDHRYGARHYLTQTCPSCRPVVDTLDLSLSREDFAKQCHRAAPLLRGSHGGKAAGSETLSETESGHGESG